MVNTEFRFEANLFGFEFEVHNSGNLIISLYNFEKTKNFSLIEELKIGSWTFNVSIGRNKVILDKFLTVPKGSMILIDSLSTSKLILEKDMFGFKSDLIIDGQRFLKPDDLKNSYFLFKCLIDTSFYISNIKITKYFQHPGQYELQLGSNIQKFQVNYCKFLKFFEIQYDPI